jgi:hypothetical protein
MASAAPSPCGERPGPVPWQAVEDGEPGVPIGMDPGHWGDRVFVNAIVAFPLDWVIPRTEFVPKAVKNTFIAEHILGEEVGVDGSDNFNDHWLVKSDDPQAAQGLLSPAMVALLMKPGLLGQWFFFENGYLVHHPNELRFEGGIEDILGRSSAILDAVPAPMHATYYCDTYYESAAAWLKSR